MRTEGQALVRGGELSLPWNLGEWVDPATLRAWVEEEIATLDWGNPAVLEYLRRRPGYDPRRLLALVSFAYLTGTFESEEVEHRIRSDEEMVKIASGASRPFVADGLSRFRRENRGLVKWVVAQVLKRALRAQLGDAPVPAGLKRRILDAAATRVDQARQLDHSREREDI